MGCTMALHTGISFNMAPTGVRALVVRVVVWLSTTRCLCQLPYSNTSLDSSKSTQAASAQQAPWLACFSIHIHASVDSVVVLGSLPPASRRTLPRIRGTVKLLSSGKVFNSTRESFRLDLFRALYHHPDQRLCLDQEMDTCMYKIDEKWITYRLHTYAINSKISFTS